MPSALLRARPWSLILALGIPLYAVSACELFLGDVEDPPGRGPDGSPDGNVSNGGAYGSTGGGGSTGRSGATSSAGGSTSGGGGSSGSGGLGDGGGELDASDASAEGGAGAGMGGSGAGGLGHGGSGAVGNGGSGSGGLGSGGGKAAGGAVGTGGVGAGGTNATGGGTGAGGGPATGGAGGCCDCDGDLQLAAGPPCGGTDCDDNDPDVFSGQTKYFQVASKHRGFDYNCLNGAERDPSDLATVDCSKLLGVGCVQGSGYFSSTNVEPACGVSGAWGTCVKQTLGCVENKVEDRVMGCH